MEHHHAATELLHLALRGSGQYDEEKNQQTKKAAARQRQWKHRLESSYQIPPAFLSPVMMSHRVISSPSPL
jgi:hypothetical protein